MHGYKWPINSPRTRTTDVAATDRVESGGGGGGGGLLSDVPGLCVVKVATSFEYTSVIAVCPPFCQA
eukprot:COSAG05_NODE_379_length_10567_cov_18.553687_16_plen_67_part_00